MLTEDKAEVVASKIALEDLRIGDAEPPYKPTTSALRKIKSRTNDDYMFDEDPMYSLRAMKYSEPYMNTIGNIGLNPFDCSFCTPYQKELLRVQPNRRRIVISYDVTGTPVSKPKTSSFDLERGKFKHIFLYVIMLQSDTGKNTPVYQVMTQRQDALNVRSLLDTWKYNCFGQKHPHEVITDDGAAILLANVQAFAKCNDLEEYDNKCFDTLFLGATPPATYIRLDRAHVIQSTLMRFSSLDKNKKRFYSRIFGLLLLSYSIEIHTDRNDDTEDNILKQNNKSKFFQWVEDIKTSVIESHINVRLNDSIERFN